MISVRSVVFVLLVCLAGPAAGDLAAQRIAFEDALRAAKRGNAEAAARHRDVLAGYPLSPYLDYYLLGNRLDRAERDAVRTFIARWPDLPVNGRLQRDWLNSLAQRGRWQMFIDEWVAVPDAALRCHWVNAHIHTDAADTPGVTEAAIELWLAGRSQPDACDPVFAWMERAQVLTDALVAQRMELALVARQFSLADWLARRLTDADRDFVRRWREMQHSPSRGLAARGLPADTERERRLLIAGLDRMARIDPALALGHLERLETRFAFDAGQRRQVLRTAALISAQRHLPQAQELLAVVAGSDLAVEEWRVRAALRAGDWQAVGERIARLPAPARGHDTWRYWAARAEQQVGDADAAMAAFAELAQGYGYHAWMAADRVGASYQMQKTATVPDDAVIESLAARAGFQRAREFVALGMMTEARAEWSAATAGLGPDTLVQAAMLADRWQWHAQAILTLGRAGRFADLDMRYPVLYPQQILPNALAYGIDAALIFSVVRNESLFVPTARSGAGAIGLMQLMPGTGREVARRLGERPPHNAALLDPATNIRLGSAYLGSVLERFHGHEAVATAAYNAGPHRVQRWLPVNEPMAADIWVETIPFDETRSYVRQVIGGTPVFEWRLGGEVRTLASRMRDVRAAE